MTSMKEISCVVGILQFTVFIPLPLATVFFLRTTEELKVITTC
ncbi:putative membrane protein [Pseudomonas syringae pv. syringae]|nr:putative membrane protein [Pseudomonas syringae pv. syringae]